MSNFPMSGDITDIRKYAKQRMPTKQFIGNYRVGKTLGSGRYMSKM